MARNGENMIELIGFEESDRNEFTELAIQSFVEDKELYGDYPPLIDIEHRSLRFIDQGNTFKILKDGKMIGGTIIFSDNKGHYTLGAIFIHPSYQKILREKRSAGRFPAGRFLWYRWFHLHPICGILLRNAEEPM